MQISAKAMLFCTMLTLFPTLFALVLELLQSYYYMCIVTIKAL